MKVPLSWLNEYINLDDNLTKLADELTMSGLEVEDVKLLGKSAIAASGGSGKNDETVWDVKVTPNRGDWLSMLGVARQIVSMTGDKINMDEPELDGSKPSTADSIKISIADPDLCYRYTGVVIRNVSVKESPDWMKDRLIAAGMRPINNVVDITNYIMFELGQPLHAFDLSLLKGREIIVRRAKAGESITSLDGTQRKLEAGMLVIADAQTPVAIAGVMGGAESEISNKTTDILLESANFNAVSIRRTSKKLQMTTESSYRFERAVDPNVALLASKRAAKLIAELGGGEVAEGILDVYPAKIEQMSIDMRVDRCNAILGMGLTAGKMVELLKLDHIQAIADGNIISCKIPTFRADVTTEIDVIEEVGIVNGYEKFPMTLPQKTLAGKDSAVGLFRNKLRRLLLSSGLQEVLTHSVIEQKLVEITGLEASRLPIRNPLSAELNSMRIMLVPSLIEVITRNQSHQMNDISVFEIGKIYSKTESGEIDEKLSIAGAMVGSVWGNAWGLNSKSLTIDFYTCKGLVEALLNGLGIENAIFSPINHKMLHPTRGAQILIDGKAVGIIGEASADFAEVVGSRGRIYVYELDFDLIMKAARHKSKYAGLPKYPSVERHLTSLMPLSVNYADIENALSEMKLDLLEKVSLLDVYKGQNLQENMQSITLSFVFRSVDRTLTEDDVSFEINKIRKIFAETLKAEYKQ